MDELQINEQQRNFIIGKLLSFSNDEFVKDNEITKFMEIYSHVKLRRFSRSAIDLFWNNWVDQHFQDYVTGCESLDEVHKDLLFYLNLANGDFDEPGVDEEGEQIDPDYTILNNKLNGLTIPR